MSCRPAPRAAGVPPAAMCTSARRPPGSGDLGQLGCVCAAFGARPRSRAPVHASGCIARPR
eukprot:9175416-Alexandrium_andersonii.AAC.1